MRFPRSSGILLHPTSLPGPYGVGDLGPEALRFADFLAEAGQTLWQVLPLGPTGYGDSPYQCFSALAGNPLLISPERLNEQGWLDASELGAAREFPEDQADFERVMPRPVAGWASINFASPMPAGWMTSRYSWRSSNITAARSGASGILASDGGSPWRWRAGGKGWHGRSRCRSSSNSLSSRNGRSCASIAANAGSG